MAGVFERVVEAHPGHRRLQRLVEGIEIVAQRVEFVRGKCHAAFAAASRQRLQPDGPVKRIVFLRVGESIDDGGIGKTDSGREAQLLGRARGDFELVAVGAQRLGIAEVDVEAGGVDLGRDAVCPPNTPQGVGIRANDPILLF